MQSITKTLFATLTFLDRFSFADSRLMHNANNRSLATAPSKLSPRPPISGESVIYYFLQFAATADYGPRNARTSQDAIVKMLRDRAPLTIDYERIGCNSFVICEIVEGDIRNIEGLLNSRMEIISRIRGELIDDAERTAFYAFA